MINLEQTHKACKYYSRKKCPHIDHDIMQRMIQERKLLSNTCYLDQVNLPTNEETDILCYKCLKFEPIKNQIWKSD